MRIVRLYITTFIIFSFSIAVCEDKGIKLYNSNQFDKAKEYYENILLERKEDPRASFGLGTTAFQQNDFSLAMKEFKSALNTDNIELKSKAYYNMANVLAGDQRLEESLAFYRESLMLNPNDLDSKINYELVKFKLQEKKNDENQQTSDDKNSNKDQTNNQNQSKDSKQNNENQDNDQNNQSDSSEKNNDEHQNSEQENNNAYKDEGSENPSNQEKAQKPIHQDKQNATAILDALKNNEKINKKIQISQTKRLKLEKDW